MTTVLVNHRVADYDAWRPHFDRAMEALKKNRYDVARVTLQTLINTYPDSEYVARAKLAIATTYSLGCRRMRSSGGTNTRPKRRPVHTI